MTSVAIDILSRSLADARRLEEQHRKTEDDYLADADREANLRHGYAHKAEELERAIVALGGTFGVTP